MNLKIIKEETCCNTGHRPFGLPWGYNETRSNCVKFKEDLKKLYIGAINYGLTTFLTGMAEGFDMIAAETIIEVKKDFPQIKLVAVIPCKNQEKKWSPSQQERYKNILSHCDDQVTLSQVPSRECFNERNLWMVQHSSVCIACWDGKPSGTGNTVHFAKENGCKMRIINPMIYKLFF